jgi:hypothetical protein
VAQGLQPSATIDLRPWAINNSGELTVLVDDVKITLLKYPFPTFDPFVIFEQGTRSAVAAPTTLMAAKAERNLERNGDLQH